MKAIFFSKKVPFNMNYTNSSAEVPKRKGQPESSIWSYLSNIEKAFKLKEVQCAHCGEVVKTWQKVDRAESHLNKCREFNRKYPVGSSDRPLFLDQKKAKTSSTSSLTSSQKSLKGFVLPGFSKKQQDTFNTEMALHFYMTASSFQKVEEKHLQKAISILRPDAKLPSRQALADVLLDKAYESLKKKDRTLSRKKCRLDMSLF